MKIKMVNKAGHLTEGAKKAFKGAHLAGGDNEIILIPGGYANDKVWRRLASLTCDLDINLYSFNEDAYVIRDFFKEALENLSQPASMNLRRSWPEYYGSRLIRRPIKHCERSTK